MIPLRDDAPLRSRPVVTYALIAINAVVFWHQFQVLFTLGPEARVAFDQRWGMVPYYLTQDLNFDSLSTPFTSMFMHGDGKHLLSNMWFLYIFGDNVEDVLGRLKFVAFYLLCGLFAALAQIVVDPSSHVPMLGASGAIAGVLGAYFLLFPRARVLLWPFPFAVPAVFFIVLWFLGNLLSGIGSLEYAGQGGIAFFAHIGGFLAGLVLVNVFSGSRNRTAGFRPSRRPYDRERRWED